MGRVQVADGGTLFLDEIGNIPLSLQVKLLNLIQNKKITPIGAGLPFSVDVRLICATNMDLAGMVREGSFREDLFFRINSFQLTIPPLRERSGDIEEFANYFLARYQNKYLKEGLFFDEDALDWIRSYSWPGNIRELKHAVERAVILCDYKTLKPADLKPASDPGFFQSPANPTLKQSEKEVVMQALKKNDGNISKTAVQLGITRQTLYAKIRKYGI